jgi:hypothetical protein
MTDDRPLNFVLGSLSPEERAQVARARLHTPALDAAILDWERRLAPLTGLAGVRSAPEALFDRISGVIARERRELGGLVSESFVEGAWAPFLPGIEKKRLWSDDAFMLRCAPGAIIPPHAHARHEHLVIISGDFSLGGRTFRVGDYHGAPAGNDHGLGRTEDGCILLVQLAA